MEKDKNSEKKANNIKKAVDVSVRAGAILLRSGAEITRVEDTVRHMMRSFGVERFDMFTLTNGIFISVTD